MGTATVETLTREEALRQKSDLLRSLGMTIEELRDRAEDYLLTVEQTARWRRVEELTWLLAE